MFTLLKRLSPESIRKIARIARNKIYEKYDSYQPFLTNRTYCGYKLFYTRGAGLINRIRMGGAHKIYEPELSNSLIHELQKHKNPIFMDLGTNIGLISITVLKHVPDVMITGFEPSPIPYKTFFTTIFANQLEGKIELFNLGVDSSSGTINFSTNKSEGSSGDGFIDTGRGGKDVKTIQVKTITLNEWWSINSKQKVNVVKMDIEGAELRALRGAESFLRESKPTIFLEISKENLKVYDYNEVDILKFFISNNYSLCELDGTICDLENISGLVEKYDTFVAKPLN